MPTVYHSRHGDGDMSIDSITLCQIQISNQLLDGSLLFISSFEINNKKTFCLPLMFDYASAHKLFTHRHFRVSAGSVCMQFSNEICRHDCYVMLILKPWPCSHCHCEYCILAFSSKHCLFSVYNKLLFSWFLKAKQLLDF